MKKKLTCIACSVCKGVFVLEIIKCSSKPCDEETSKCIDGKDSFRCECLQGFQKDKAKLRKCKGKCN